MVWNRAQQSKNVCFTINMTKEMQPDRREEPARWEQVVDAWCVAMRGEILPSIRARLNPTYIVAGAENCGLSAKDGSNPHFQGFFQLGKRMLNSKISDMFPRGTHFEVMRGTPAQADAYCRKEDMSPFVFGERNVGQGERTDLYELYLAAKKGKSDLELAEMDPRRYLQYGRGLREIRAAAAPKRTWASEIIVLHGKTGCGKTRAAWEGWEPEMLDGKWPFINGYTATNPHVCFDDFDPSGMNIETLLKVCDRYPMNVNVKGGFMNWNPKVIIFTSNLHPKDWYPKANEEHRAALLRRIEEFGHMEELLTPHLPKELGLARYFAKKTADASGSGAGSNLVRTRSGSLTDDTQVIDLTQSDSELDWDSDEEHSCPSDHELQRRAAKRAKHEAAIQRASNARARAGKRAAKQ